MSRDLQRTLGRSEEWEKEGVWQYIGVGRERPREYNSRQYIINEGFSDCGLVGCGFLEQEHLRVVGSSN